MAFPIFMNFATELREMILHQAVLEEANGRIFFIHMESLCVMPTRNNRLSLLHVNQESRKIALQHYPVSIPVYKLPPQLNNPCLSFADWSVKTANVEWGGVRSCGSSGLDVKSPSRRGNLEQYWHHYAMPKLASSANQHINDFGDGQLEHKGYIYLRASNDERFIMSYGISNRDNASDIRSSPPNCDHLVVRNAQPDVCAYQIALDSKAQILGKQALHKYEIPRRYMTLRLPIEVRRNIRDLFFVDAKKESRESRDDTDNVSDSAPALTRVDEKDMIVPLWEEPEFHDWISKDFPLVYQLIQQPRPRLLCYEIRGSQSHTLVGRVEAETSECLGIDNA